MQRQKICKMTKRSLPPFPLSLCRLVAWQVNSEVLIVVVGDKDTKEEESWRVRRIGGGGGGEGGKSEKTSSS